MLCLTHTFDYSRKCIKCGLSETEYLNFNTLYGPKNIKNVTLDKWDYRFLELSKLISSWSKDPNTKVGSVIVKDKIVISMGFNGLSSLIKDEDQYLQNRELKNLMIIHSEENCIKYANQDLKGTTIYTYPMAPCGRCSEKIIEAGITKVISPITTNEKWLPSILVGQKLFREARVEYQEVDFK